MISKIRKGVVVSALAIALTLPAAATTFDSEALDSFVSTATACVVGEVTSIEYVTQTGLTFTKASFRVSDTAFGSTASEISVMVPGGLVANTKYPIAQTVAGAPQLRTGQRMMLVLNATSQGQTYSISGLANGAINVIDNGSGPQVVLAGTQGTITLADAITDLQALRRGESQIDSE